MIQELQRKEKSLFEIKGHSLPISEKMLKTETGNKMYGKEVIKLLLDQQGDRIEITEDVVKAAKGNLVNEEK